MVTDDEREIAAALLSWGRRQKSLARERDPLVLRALKANVSKEAIHQFTGVSRSTIDRIQAGKEPTL